jgi:hypothetical protein
LKTNYLIYFNINLRNCFGKLNKNFKKEKELIISVFDINFFSPLFWTDYLSDVS